MTYEALYNYINLNDDFYTRCSQICEILSQLDKSYKCADTFEIVNDEVEFTGDEYWGYGGHAKRSGEFPLKFIYTSDEEIERYVSDKLAERECEQKRIEAEVELLKLERERAEYEMLKKKFEVE